MKRHRLRKVGEGFGTTVTSAAPTAEEPRREASPPPSDEYREEAEIEMTAPSPARPNTPPMWQEGATEEAAMEATTSAEEPVEAEAEEATAQPLPPSADP